MTTLSSRSSQVTHNKVCLNDFKCVVFQHSIGTTWNTFQVKFKLSFDTNPHYNIKKLYKWSRTWWYTPTPVIPAAVEAKGPGTRSSRSPIIKNKSLNQLGGREAVSKKQTNKQTQNKTKNLKSPRKFPSRSIILSPEVNECEALHTSFRNSHPNN